MDECYDEEDKPVIKATAKWGGGALGAGPLGAAGQSKFFPRRSQQVLHEVMDVVLVVGPAFFSLP
jgi:hypothetical protein